MTFPPESQVTAEHIEAHRLHLTRKIAEMMRKKPDHTHYDQLNMMGLALAAVERMSAAEPEKAAKKGKANEVV